MEPSEPTTEDDAIGATGRRPPTPVTSLASQGDGLTEVAQVALKLGVTAFGGPAAHIAMLREETVVRRQWLTDAYFLDLVGATNLIPGPNSTEMVIHIGYLQAGWRGLLLAGTLFILPAATIVLTLGWAYVQYGATPAGEALLYGIKPVVIAVVAQALWGLGRIALKGPLLVAIGAAAAALYLFGFNELAILFGSALVVLLIRTVQHLSPRQLGATMAAPFAGLPLTILPTLLLQMAPVPVSLMTLFLAFLKIGAVLYGSGYVLLAFLRNDFVERLGWLTEEQLLDAVAVGQFTPGPGVTTAALVGYIAGGLPGALLATLGIFLPAFVFVALTGPLVPRMRRWPLLGAMLDGVNVAAVGLMAAVLVVLTRDAVVDWFTLLLALAAALVLLRTRLNSAWLVLGGGALGIGYRALLG